MKTTIKLLAIAVLIAFAFIGCSNGTTSSSGPAVMRFVNQASGTSINYINIFLNSGDANPVWEWAGDTIGYGEEKLFELNFTGTVHEVETVSGSAMNVVFAAGKATTLTLLPGGTLNKSDPQ